MGFSIDHTILFYFLIYVRRESADATAKGLAPSFERPDLRSLWAVALYMFAISNDIPHVCIIRIRPHRFLVEIFMKI